MSILRSMSVVIPARNEERLIGRCLTAVFDAVQYTRQEFTPHALTVEVIVVADACHDATAQLARDAGATVVSLDARNVGKARATGADLALRRGVGPHAERWIANTDADSVVPRNWLLDQIAIASRGYDVMIGTVRPDFADLTKEQDAHTGISERPCARCESRSTCRRLSRSRWLCPTVGVRRQ
jgi:glycosyltransferase involved in cell wall biosynthesis